MSHIYDDDGLPGERCEHKNCPVNCHLGCPECQPEEEEEEEEEEEILKLKRGEVMKKNDRVSQMGKALDKLADRVPYGNLLLACGLTADFLEEAANKIDSLQKEIDKLKGGDEG